MKFTEPTIKDYEIVHNNLNFSIRQVLAWLNNLNDGKSHSPDEWRKLSSAQKRKVIEDQRIASDWALHNRTFRPTNDTSKVIALFEKTEEDGKKTRYRQPLRFKDSYSVEFVDDSLNITVPDQDENVKILEVSATRSFDRTYEPVKQKKPLDVVQINLDKELTKVRWYNGESFMSWYSKPVEERYPLHPGFIETKISNEDELNERS